MPRSSFARSFIALGRNKAPDERSWRSRPDHGQLRRARHPWRVFPIVGFLADGQTCPPSLLEGKQWQRTANAASFLQENELWRGRHGGLRLLCRWVFLQDHGAAQRSSRRCDHGCPSAGIMVEQFVVSGPHAHLYDTEHNSWVKLMNWQHSTMYLFFGIYGMVLLVSTASRLVPVGVHQLTLSIALFVEGDAQTVFWFPLPEGVSLTRAVSSQGSCSITTCTAGLRWTHTFTPCCWWPCSAGRPAPCWRCSWETTLSWSSLVAACSSCRARGSTR